MIRTERTQARARKKNDALELRPYADDVIDAIEAQYAAEGPRGAETRWWEDVAVGDTVGPMVKGPMTVTDMVCWHAGVGMGLYGVKALRLGYQNRTRIPRFYQRDELNVPDVMQRVHWDPEFARRAGNPTTFDYGRMRETWLVHLCTDWMGDEAWLWKLDCEFRKFNFVGDTQWLSGTVTDHYVAEGERPAVDIELSAVNQRGSRRRRATPPSCCRAASTARCACPRRPAARATSKRSSPPSARGTKTDERPGRAQSLPLRRGAQRAARRPGARVRDRPAEEAQHARRTRSWPP